MSYETKGLDAAQRAYDNYIPDESPLYHCDSCGGEIYEGEEDCYYNRYTGKWYCDDCMCQRTAEREEYEE